MLYALKLSGETANVYKGKMMPREKISRMRKLLQTDIRNLRLDAFLPPKGRPGLAWLGILLVSVRKFIQDASLLRASALTFYTVLSVVPIMAMAFGIAKGFGAAKLLEKQILENFPAPEAVLLRILEFANNMLENTRGDAIAGIGIVVLFWTVIKVLSHIERSLNAIWQVEKHRSFLRKFSDYLSIILVSPVLIILSGSTTVFITTRLQDISDRVALIGYFAPAIFFSFKLIPYVLIWIVFTLIYTIMPNTRVRLKSALVAAVVAGTLYQLLQWGYIKFQVGVAQYNAIYGSFAALPLFLVWLQLSWSIVLFGAQISYVHQNMDALDPYPDYRELSFRLKKLLCLSITRMLVQKFEKGEPPSTLAQVSKALEIHPRLTRQLLDDLCRAGILSRVHIESTDAEGYQPGLDIHGISISRVIGALERIGLNALPSGQVPDVPVLSEKMEPLEKIVENSKDNSLLKDI